MIFIRKFILTFFFPEVVSIIRQFYSGRDQSCAIAPPEPSQSLNEMLNLGWSKIEKEYE